MKDTTYNALEKRFPSNEYALMLEVRDKAGFNASRSADCVAVNLWPSRGLSITGIELKSFRNDWLGELKKPEKAENIFQYCDYFYLLTDGENIAKLEEIPVSWGWMEVKGERIIIKKDAPKLSPKELTRNFVCAMLKRAADRTDFVHVSSIQDRIDQAKESAKTINGSELARTKIDLESLERLLGEFYLASGIRLENRQWSQFDPKKTGEAVKFINSNGVESIKNQLIGLEGTAKTVLERISRSIEIFKADETINSHSPNKQ